MFDSCEQGGLHPSLSVKNEDLLVLEEPMPGGLREQDKIWLYGGYDMEPKWLGGSEGHFGQVISFIPGQNDSTAAVVKLEEPITFDDITGNIVVLELRYVGAKWKSEETVHIELCDFMPEAKKWQQRRQGRWIESHGSYKKV